MAATVHQDLKAENAKLLARIQELEAEKTKKLRLEISKPKPAEGNKPATVGGGIKLIGIRYPFPVTFYANEWLRILDYGDEIRKFIEEHKSELTFGKNGQNGH